MALSTTVTAGKTFATNEKVTSAKLNQLVANATVAISGSASTAQIADDAVTAAKTAVDAHFYLGTGGGTATAHTVTTGQSLVAYTTGMWFRYKAPATLTTGGAVTVNVDSIGTKNIKKRGATDPEAGDLKSGNVLDIIYDGTNFQLMNPAGQAEIITGQDAGSTDSYAITPSPTVAAYYTGLLVAFKANTVNTGTASLDVSSLGAKTIVKQKDVTLQDGDIKAGQWVLVQYDGTNFQMLSPVSPTNTAAVQGQTKNLYIRPGTTAASQMDVSADELILKDSASRSLLASTVSFTVDITAGTQPNGRETGGTEAASTMYHIWGISNGTTTAGVLSTSTSSPNLSGASFSGYTYYAYLGSVFNNSSSDFVRSTQRQNIVNIATTDVLATSTTGVTSYTESAAITVIPTTAKTITGTFGGSGATIDISMAVASNTSGDGEQIAAGRSLTGATINGFRLAAPFRVVVTNAQKLSYKMNATGTDYKLVVTGYTL